MYRRKLINIYFKYLKIENNVNFVYKLKIYFIVDVFSINYFLKDLLVIFYVCMIHVLKIFLKNV